MIYLDNAATTALSETAGKAMEPYFSDLYGNPSSSYRFGQEAKRAIEAGRQALALREKSILPEGGRKATTGLSYPYWDGERKVLSICLPVQSNILQSFGLPLSWKVWG